MTMNMTFEPETDSEKALVYCYMLMQMIEHLQNRIDELEKRIHD